MRTNRLRSALLIATSTVALVACGTDAPANDRGDASAPPSPPLLPEGGATPPSADPTPPSASVDDGDDPPPDDPNVAAVRFLGRFDTSDPKGPECGWPGCRIIARFQGTQVSVTFNEKIDDWMIGGPSEWDVTIDGVLLPKQVLWGGQGTYALGSGLAAGIHTVELFKRSEAQNGITQFMGFDFGDGKLLPPPARSKRRIEIIGDSTATGFGIEGNGPDCPGIQQASTFQNFHRSFGARLGEIFGAEVNGTAYSGKGINKNIWRPDLETMPVLYSRANPIDPSSTFQVATYIPKVVVVMIGGLDFAIGQPYDDAPEPVSQFTATYEAFLKTLRSAYPHAEVFAVISPSAVDIDADHAIRSDLEKGVTAAVSDRTTAGDAHVHLVVPPLSTPDELTGCEGHGNPAFHERLAQEIADVVRSTIGW